MIVPRNRFLFAIAATLPLAIVHVLLFITGLSIVIIAALIDGILSHKSTDDLAVRLPETVRLSKDKEGKFEALIRNNTSKQRRLKIGLPVPSQIRLTPENLEISLPVGSHFFAFSWTCTALERGKFFIGRTCIEEASRFGFWNLRSSIPTPSEVRVYPKLFRERRKVAALFLNRKDPGIHAQRLVGQGREFEKLREYVSGDSYEQLHWKATARRGRPITKVFQIERTQEVYAVIDSSRLTAREIDGETTLEFFLRAALLLGQVAERQGDLFGLVSFSDRVHGILRAGNGKAHYNACREALCPLQPQIVSPDFGELCSFLRTRLRRRALLMFLTDLNDPLLAENFARSSELIARQHVIIVHMVRPSASRPLFRGPVVTNTDELYQNLSGHILWQNLRELQNLLHTKAVALHQIEQSQLSVDLIAQYLKVKQRQLI